MKKKSINFKQEQQVLPLSGQQEARAQSTLSQLYLNTSHTSKSS